MIDKRSIPLPWAVLPLMVTVVCLFFVIFVLKAPIYTGMMIGWLCAVLVALKFRTLWRELWQGTYRGMKNTFLVVQILILIGAVIAAWLASGTVPTLVWYGIGLIQPEYLVVTAFLLAAGVSMALGTSVGTLSTMGVAVAGMASVFEISPALVGGALVSGAMVGDRMSPVSGSFHLVATMTDTKPEDNYKPMLQTGLPMFVLCLVLFAWLGYGDREASVDPLTSPLLREMTDHFQLHWYMMIPPLIVLVLAFFKVPILRNLSIGIVGGVLLAVLVQGASLMAVLQALWLGFDLTVNDRSILHGGGVWPMFNSALMIVAAGALNGVLEESGMMQTIIKRLLERVKKTRGLIVSTVLLSVAITMIACNQALSIIVPARALRDTYEQMGVPSSLLVRSLADSGVVVSPLVPWNLHGILISTSIGIPTMVFWPYAFYLWGLPILTLALCFLAKNKDNSNKLDKLLQF